MNVNWAEAVPSPEEYVRIRAASGLVPRTIEAARAGLAGTLYSVTARDGGLLIAMGRIVGDGGCFVQVVDVAVEPDWQGRGLGQGVMERLMAWCEANLEPCCHISLVSSPRAMPLYRAFGFEPTNGMDRYPGPRP